MSTATELKLPLTDVSSMYGMGMFIDGAELDELEKPKDRAWRIGSARRRGNNLDRNMLAEERENWLLYGGNQLGDGR
ncbi:hypothetical protein A9Z42_0034690 [Trichoderma parareesei]|uniref:Uncharacterized protein n=1 Tax=Trichoderma parareesei TaxID=858221 RepID=A0A2H2ZDN8_TRIPA|nr:hypothetical protein A9Z42_0034690 [Trichoderma parareesei]